MKQILILLMALLPIGAIAQSVNQNALTWSSSSAKNYVTDEVIELGTKFETDSNTIKWIQGGGSWIYEFSVRSIQGEWGDVTADGQVAFTVEFKGYTGTIQFQRTAGTTKVKIDIDKSDGKLLPFEFSISEIQTR